MSRRVPLQNRGKGASTPVQRSRRARDEAAGRPVHDARVLLDEFPVLIWRSGLDAKCTYFNKAWCDFTGRSLEQERGEGWVEGVHPEDRERCVREYLNAFEKRARFVLEYRLRNRDGDYRWIRDIGQPIFEYPGGFAGYIGGCFDLTESRIATEQLRRNERQLRAYASQLRTLSRRLVEAEETHRRELARELHDRVGRYLTALNLNLNIVRNEPSSASADATAARIEDSLQLVEAAMDAVGDLMSGLRPPMLDDLGLIEALKWHASEFEKRTGIATAVNAGESGPRMSPAVELTLFRIAEEALNNIAKHSHSCTARIELEVGTKTARLDVIDDGTGFDPTLTHRASDRPHWGLLSMRERAQAVGGAIHIDSAPGHGTRLTAEVQRLG